MSRLLVALAVVLAAASPLPAAATPGTGTPSPTGPAPRSSEDKDFFETETPSLIGQPVPVLITKLGDRSARVRLAAAEALAQSGTRDEKVVSPLATALTDDDARVRAFAAIALGRTGSAKALDPLLAATRDSDALVQFDAVRALGALKGQAALTALGQVLKGPDARLRGCAATALGQLGDARAVPKLLEALKDPDANVAADAAAALGEIGDWRALAPLVAAMKTGNATMRRSAVRAIRWLGAPGEGEADLALRRRLDRAKIGPMRIQNVEMKDVLALLRDSGAPNVHVHWAALAAVGIGESTLMTINTAASSPDGALMEILLAADPSARAAFAVKSGILVVSTVSDLEACARAWAAAGDAGATGGCDPATRQKLLASVRRITCDGVELQLAIQSIQESSKIDFQVQWPALEPLGVTPSKKVSMMLTDVAACNVLCLLMHDLDVTGRIGYGVKDGAVVISTREQLAKLPPPAPAAIAAAPEPPATAPAPAPVAAPAPAAPPKPSAPPPAQVPVRPPARTTPPSAPAPPAVPSAEPDKAAVEKQAAQLKQRLQANPKDGVSRGALVRLLLIEMDNPDEAAQYVGEGADADMRKYVPAAAKGVAAAPELACLALGQWYHGLVVKADLTAKPAMLARAIAYYERFLALHTAEDASRSQAAAALAKAHESLDKWQETIKAALPPKDDSINLLTLIDIAQDFMANTPTTVWTRQGPTLCGTTINRGWSGINAPVTPDGDYELEVKFALGEKDGSFHICLPLRSTAVMVTLQNGKSGLSSINGLGPGQSGQGTQTAFVAKRIYCATVLVSNQKDVAGIKADLDGTPVVRWEGAPSVLSNVAVPPPSYLHQLPTSTSKFSSDKKRLGFALFNAGATIYSAKLRMISGEAKMLRPVIAAPQK
ncbi:MAG: HEAT repeat domain-containing protein [Planctomycetota bacterium]|nr:HEAT repeat domain-containing protein [Planctomycetota bacterium]